MENNISKYRYVEMIIKNNLGNEIKVLLTAENNLFIISNNTISLSDILQLKNDLNSFTWSDFITDFNESIQFSNTDGREISYHNIICFEEFRVKDILLDEKITKKIQSFVDNNIKTKIICDLLNINNILADLFEEKLNIFRNLELKRTQRILYDKYFNEKYSHYFNKFQDLILEKDNEKIKTMKNNIIGNLVKNNWIIDFNNNLNIMSVFLNEETEEFTFRIRIFNTSNLKGFISKLHSYFLNNLGFKNTLTKITQIDEKTLEFSGLKLENNHFILDRKELGELLKFGKYKEYWYVKSNYLYYDELFEHCIINRNLCRELLGVNYVYFNTCQLKEILIGKYSKLNKYERKIRSLKLSYVLKNINFNDDINKEKLIERLNKDLNLKINLSDNFDKNFLEYKNILIDIYDKNKCRFVGELSFGDKEDFKRFINSINCKSYGFSVRGDDD